MDAIEKQMTKASSLFGTERKSATNPVDSRYICLLSKKTTSPPLLEHFVFQGTGTGHPIHRNGSSQPPAVSAVYRCEFLPDEWTKQEKSFIFFFKIIRVRKKKKLLKIFKNMEQLKNIVGINFAIFKKFYNIISYLFTII